MVDFDVFDEGGPSGPCRRIMKREGDFIREMVSKTEGAGKEYVANIIEIDGNIGHTDMIQGQEESIIREQAAQSMMDSFEVARDLKETPGSVNQNRRKRHVIHTHPNGFKGLSFEDMKSFTNRIVTDADVPDSELVATMTEDGIWLGGIYKTEELTDEEYRDLQSTLSLANSTGRSIDRYTAEAELLETFKRVGFGFCRVFFPER